MSAGDEHGNCDSPYQSCLLLIPINLSPFQALTHTSESMLGLRVLSSNTDVNPPHFYFLSHLQPVLSCKQGCALAKNGFQSRAGNSRGNLTSESNEVILPGTKTADVTSSRAVFFNQVAKTYPYRKIKIQTGMSFLNSIWSEHRNPLSVCL